MSEYQENALKVSLFNSSSKIDYHVFIEFFIVTLEVVIDSTWLFLSDETLLNHMLRPISMRGEHSDESFS